MIVRPPVGIAHHDRGKTAAGHKLQWSAAAPSREPPLPPSEILRGPGESYSDVIIKLAELEAKGEL